MPDHKKHIIISRVDSIGDVVLTLPLAGVLKALIPGSTITFLGNRYTEAVVRLSKHIDGFIAWDAVKDLPAADQVDTMAALKADVFIHVFPRSEIARLAAKAKIPMRLGTSRRFYHWLYCNRRVTLARRQSDIHESQLNLKLLTPLGAKSHYDLSEIPKYYGLSGIRAPLDAFEALLSKERYNLIIHPKSKGSAREWGLDNFSRLIRILPQSRYKLFITGTKEDGQLLQPFLAAHKGDVIDLTGRFDLDGLIQFINRADGLVAASTGPLHIAAALGSYALGLYAPMRPIHPGRWAPVGENAQFLVVDKVCDQCRESNDCLCIKSITPQQVFHQIEAAYAGRPGKALSLTT